MTFGPAQPPFGGRARNLQAIKRVPERPNLRERGFRVGLIAGSNEFAQGVWKVKNLATKEEQAIPEADVVAAVRKLLG